MAPKIVAQKSIAKKGIDMRRIAKKKIQDDASRAPLLLMSNNMCSMSASDKIAEFVGDNTKGLDAPEYRYYSLYGTLFCVCVHYL